MAPDLLLTVTLERLYHDLSVEPGALQLLVNATLTDAQLTAPLGNAA